MLDEADFFRQILHRATARYLTVRPEGVILESGQPPLKRIDVRILNHGVARTLYRGKKPMCRSLDGVKSITAPDRRCQPCFERKHCTPQVRVDLLLESTPYKVLLAYTSAKNFLLYWNALSDEGLEPPQVTTTIRIVHRGSWGELRFERKVRI